MADAADTVAVLAALGHETRLAIFRLLVQAGDEGLNVTDIGAHLKMPPSTLAHHMSGLVSANLVIQERRGRETINRANYRKLNGALDYLTSECCSGVCLVRSDAA